MSSPETDKMSFLEKQARINALNPTPAGVISSPDARAQGRIQ